MNNKTISVDEFLRAYWDVAVYQDGLNLLKSDPDQFLLKVDVTRSGRLIIPIKVVETQVENYLNLKLEECRTTVNKFSEESPEEYNRILNITS